MSFDAKSFRKALGQFATGVTVVSVGVDGGVHGMTANAFTSVSLDPPLVLVCIDRRNATHRYIQEKERFAVSVLAQSQVELSQYFAGQRDVSATPVWSSEHSETPVLEGAIAWIDCRLVHVYDGGDHSIFVGRVETLNAPGGRPLLFFDGNYAKL